MSYYISCDTALSALEGDISNLWYHPDLVFWLNVSPMSNFHQHFGIMFSVYPSWSARDISCPGVALLQASPYFKCCS
jgi:hypothetical protein